jgi:hypothetical protein
MVQLAVVMLALFGEMERTYAAERASHARAVATADGRRTGRPSVIDADKLEHAALLRDKGFSMKDITAKTGLNAPPCTGTCRPAPPPLTWSSLMPSAGQRRYPCQALDKAMSGYEIAPRRMLRGACMLMNCLTL